MGRREEGRDLVNILKRAKNHYNSIGSIDPNGGDYGAQIEGRRLFGQFIDTLCETIETKERQMHAKDQEDFT